MALLGVYVGVVPVALGMLWLPCDPAHAAQLAAAGDGADDRPARLPRDRRDARGPRAGEPGLAGLRRRGARLRSGPSCRYLAADRRVAMARQAARKSRPARKAPGRPWRCWSPSASACTTSARASRSAPPTRSARWRSAHSWWWASQSTTPPRGWRSWRPIAKLRPSLGRLAVLGLIAGGPAVVRRLDRRGRVQLEPRRLPLRLRCRRDRAGDRAAGAVDPRRAAVACCTRLPWPACWPECRSCSPPGCW